MAVMLDDPSTPIDMNTLANELKKQGLPSYARPIFIRLTKHIEMTGHSSSFIRESIHLTSSFFRNFQSEKNSISR